MATKSHRSKTSKSSNSSRSENSTSESSYSENFSSEDVECLAGSRQNGPTIKDPFVSGGGRLQAIDRKIKQYEIDVKEKERAAMQQIKDINRAMRNMYSTQNLLTNYR